MQSDKSFTLFSVIFISFFIVLVLISCLFGIYYYNIASNQAISLMSNIINGRTTEISARIDAKINEMEAVAADVIYSNTVKSTLKLIENTEIGQFKSIDFYEYDNTMTLLRESIYSYTGSRKGADQINIYLPDGKQISSGLSNSLRYAPESSKQITNLFAGTKNSNIVQYSKIDPDISRYYLSDISKNFISLIRENTSILNGDRIYVEIKKSLLQIISNVVYYQPIYNESIVLFDGMGNQIYPLTKDASFESYYDIIANNSYSGESMLVNKNKKNGKAEYLLYHHSAYSGILTLIIIDQQILTHTIINTFVKFLPIMFLVLFTTIVISLVIARRITNPIISICRYVKETDFNQNDIHRLHSIKTNLLELNTLTESFTLLQSKLKDANDRQMVLKHQEMQSKMLSLQSQMNPHFLYNSLATIQTMADENMNQEIIHMCQMTSRILRYISSDKEQLVPLKAELSHTRDFLKCMCIRFNSDLTYKFQIPNDMKNIMVPKLCVQQIVENSVKYSIKTKPPWKISIVGTIDTYGDDKTWLLSIKDNGPGFSLEKQIEIQDQMDLINSENLLPSLELVGMGLLNIYIRLKLSYSDNFVFCIKDAYPTGAEIIIGGKYEL